MQKISNWESIEVKNNDDYKRIVPGGYVCRITKVENHPDKQYLYIEFDVAEGEFMGYGSEFLERNGFTPLRFYRSYTDKALSMFKSFILDIEESNAPHYHWDWDEQKLVGRTFGAVLGEEEYKKQDGSIGTRFNVRTKTSAAIRDGKFKIPEKKLLPVEQNPASAFTALDDSSELPF